RMRKIAGQPCSRPSSWLSQSSVLAKRLCTTRTTHFPPARASTLHSVATVGEPGGPMVLSATKRLGASHDGIVAGQAMTGPNLLPTCPAARPSPGGGPNHTEMPGPVAIARHTSSGVPGTSTSTCTDRRPDGSFFTLTLFPFLWLPRALDTPRSSVDVDARPVRTRCNSERPAR